jgi:uncharacterized membrane protein
VSTRLAEQRHEAVRIALDGLGLAAVAYLTAMALDGPALVVAWAGQACALGAVARACRHRFAAGAAFAFLGLAACHALAVEAPPESFIRGASDLPGAVIALVAVAFAAGRLGLTAGLPQPWPRSLKAGAAATALYMASVAIVTAFQPGPGAESTLLDVGMRQEGQMFVSALWSLAGALAVGLGLRRGLRELRVGGLALLVAAGVKVFVFDLATLTSIYRVGSFIGLGVVLLAGSYAWQRMRPPALPDLREA